MTAPPRVLLVTGPASGGLKRHVDTLAERLPERGYEVAAASPDGVFPRGTTTFRFDLGDRPRPAADLRAVAELRRAIVDWRPELIHAHGVKAALLTLLAFSGGRPPVVVTYHNRWLGGPLTGLLRLLAPRAQASIAVSRAVQESLENHAIRARNLRVIHNGVDPDLFRPIERASEGRPFTALFLGRLTEEKGISLLLETAGALEGGGRRDLRFLVAGDGPLRPQVEAESRRAGSLVEYLGPQSDVLPVYAQADAVIMPSLSEGLPMTALEAMSCGLPLIASDVGGLPEVVEPDETGLLLPTRDPQIWARAILQLAEGRDAAVRLGAAGRRRVLQEFTLERMMDGVEGTYGHALRCAGAAAPETNRRGAEHAEG
jgi:glycosyltransferase involved in cell wall biosynthesis